MTEAEVKPLDGIFHVCFDMTSEVGGMFLWKLFFFFFCPEAQARRSNWQFVVICWSVIHREDKSVFSL